MTRIPISPSGEELQGSPGDVLTCVAPNEWEGQPGGGGAVSSVFGRIGAVIAAANDYAASLITNNSSVGGVTVAEALDDLAGQISALITGVSSVFGRSGAVVAVSGDYTAAQVTNNSGVTGATVSAALDTLAPSALYHWGAVASSATSSFRYFPRTFAAVGTTEAPSQITVGRACTITGIRASFGVAAAVDSISFTLRRNGASTTVVLTVAAGQTSGVATGFSLALAAGDRIAMAVDQSGTEAIAAWNCSVTIF